MSERPPTRRTRAKEPDRDPPRTRRTPADDESSAESPAPRHRNRALDGRRAAGLAAARVRELTGRTPEGIVALERVEQGWRVGVEVLESRRIPDSTDLLAVYSVELDGDGELIAYRREQRYHRGRAEERS